MAVPEVPQRPEHSLGQQHTLLDHLHPISVALDPDTQIIKPEDAQITGKTVASEHRDPTWDLIPRLISRRAKWLGHVLRAQESHPVQRVLKGWVGQVQGGGGSYAEGTVLAEAPAHDSFAQLTDLAVDRETWRHWTVNRDLDVVASGRIPGMSDAYMVGAGYVFDNGVWTERERRANSSRDMWW